VESKVKKWNGYEIRFVDYEGEWWAVAADAA
jgi:prophage antirepressor-like protein